MALLRDAAAPRARHPRPEGNLAVDIEDLDNRRSYVGTTLVYSDRWGPREFWRHGQQVGCICDPGAGIECKFHGDRRRRAEGAEEQ